LGGGGNNFSLQKVGMLFTIYVTQGIRLGHIGALLVASEDTGLDINADKTKYA
jgi:hypothetical protein